MQTPNSVKIAQRARQNLMERNAYRVKMGHFGMFQCRTVVLVIAEDFTTPKLSYVNVNKESFGLGVFVWSALFQCIITRKRKSVRIVQIAKFMIWTKENVRNVQDRHHYM
jgi:hypothetical protein